MRPSSPLALSTALALSLLGPPPQVRAASAPEPAEAPDERPATESESSAAPGAEPESAAEPEPAAEPELAPTAGESASGDAQVDGAAAVPAPTPVARPIPPPPPPPTVVEVDPKHYAMVLAGNIVIGLGGAALVTMAVGLGVRSDAIRQREGLVASGADADALAAQDTRIQTGTVVAISGGAATAALFATGITLVALGYSRERKRRLELPRAAVGPRFVGLQWGGEF